jgi:uncharacterized membrane protein YvbJ
MGYCTECGSKVEEEARFCPNCGHEMSQIPSMRPSSVASPPPQYIAQYSTPPSYQQYQKRDNTKGIIALVFGILGLFLLPIIGSIVAIILGALSRSQEEDNSLGTIGIILGVIGIICWIVFFVVLFSWIFSMFGNYPPYPI